jgi:hypothetical protein
MRNCSIFSVALASQAVTRASTLTKSPAINVLLGAAHITPRRQSDTATNGVP